MAWNGKEMGFVGCIKRAEEERVITQSENCKLVESLKAAETMARAAREETHKLRDILKQAISEANAAKAAADIAREENYQLKDCLAEKEEELHFLTEENKRLAISEAAAQEHVREINRLLSSVSSELKTEDVEENGSLSSPNWDDQGDEMDNSEAFSFNLEGLKFTTEPEDSVNKVSDEDPTNTGILKGSIFDTDAETPPAPDLSHQRRYSYAFTDDEGSTDSADFYHYALCSSIMKQETNENNVSASGKSDDGQKKSIQREDHFCTAFGLKMVKVLLSSRFLHCTSQTCYI
ncbi:UNVERIFIED_CONTAM: hypothetical protein Slati_4554900 [Sesamum latifolium]|uniref:Uncharacterized protein n=1 Tax=Sesamum latifolium TaxID=2727402 RepID=A0AAW2S4E5_9LAMI